MPVHGPACSELFSGRPYFGPPTTDQARPEDWPSLGSLVTRYSPVKAALQTAAIYLAAELGPKGIRVHPISPGPISTRAASGIDRFDELMQRAAAKAPARMLSSIEDVGLATAFLATDYAKLITGDVMYIDGGYHIVG